MNRLLLPLLFLSVCWMTANAQVTPIDDFDSYVSGSYIQVQNKAWSRYGDATADGINSIAEGFKNRGAAYAAIWDGTNFGSIRYTFPKSQNIAVTPVLTLELAVLPSSVTGTEVTATVANATTSYETVARSLANTSYSIYSFDFAHEPTSCLAGSDSLETVLASATSLTVTFTNTTGHGAQTIHFDDFALNATAPSKATTSAP